ncbi:MAG TPA: glycosyltransferase family 87 protein [Candidatus Dormibacteraeota bacterium]|nr:glycosyltransferase family 87 protein [Candidatus Dormibacteraeota bacterium]
MSRPRPPAAAVAALAAVLLAGYAVLWAGVSPTDLARSDFTSFYVGGTLLREGHGAAIYDPALQAWLHASLVAPLHTGNLPFVNPPAAALVFAPITLLPLAAAYHTWQVIQLLMLVAALVIAARYAPWPAAMRRGGVVAATVLAGLAGTGTLALGLLGQWDGLSALGLAIAYALWRRERRFSGGAVLAGCVLLAKPHLAFGLAALVLAWRDRRVLAGAGCAVAVLAIVSLAIAGPAGIDGFIASVRDDAGRWPLASMLGFTGLTGSWLGDGAAASLIAAAGSVAALAGCVVAGRRLARDRRALEPCLALATALSLLASPHLLAQDLVLLGPVVVVLMAWAGGRDGALAWPGPCSRAVLGGWALVAVAAALDLGQAGIGAPGRLVPWALLALAGLVTWQLRRPLDRTLAAAPT